MMRKVWALLLLAPLAAAAQQTPFWPDKDEVLKRFGSSRALEQNSQNKIYKTGVNAHWSADGRTFWYCNEGKGGAKEYILADAASGTKRPAFDAQQLAGALGKATGDTYDGRRLVIPAMTFSADGKEVRFETDGKYWRCNLHDYTLQRADSLPKPPPPRRNYRPGRWESFETRRRSPDNQWVALIDKGNIYLRHTGRGDTLQYTTDGTPAKPYGSLAWSPDSKYLVCYRVTPVADSSVYYILTSMGGTRGQLRSQLYKQPGDPFTTYEMHLLTVGKPGAIKVNTEIIDFFDAPRLHWRKDARYFMYEKVDRGHQRFRIIEVDAQTAATRTVVDERSNTFIQEARIFTKYLPDTDEILWTSEKDGWRHLYLVDALTGRVKNPVTAGEWVVRDIDSVDVQKREVWFRANGMHAGEDPYHIHHYRIGFNGKKLVQLTPEKGHHFVTYSPDKKYYIDTYSQIGVPHVTELRSTATGRKIMELERADVTEYFATGIAPVESFTAKGRDGKTDIWGIVCRPSNFDTSKKYPIIENIYAGPHDAFVPKSFTGNFRDMQYLAELGFIVVQIDGMGTANRSKAFHDVCWKNIADAGFPDRILWMKALAKKYPYVDTGRVGLYGTSAGGQNALGGLLFHPEFYKAAVSACGCHDNRIDKQWWNEQWMGYPVGPHYDAQSNITHAHKLQGKLLLIVGEADTNVPPESTYRVVDALIRARKDFDFLAVPGMGHSDGGPYGRMKRYQFFVKHLLGVEAPLGGQ